MGNGQLSFRRAPLRALCALCVEILLLSSLAAGATPSSAPAGDSRDEYLYLPPALAGSVVFYHSFSQGPDKPEVNLLSGSVLQARGGRLAEALTGSGWSPTERTAGLSLTKLDWPLTKPITVGLWFRLDEPMKAETGFHLVGLHAARGYISNFAAGKGPWCALKEPTFVVQLYNFPGISNVNGIYSGTAWLAEKQWHHAALTVSEGSRVRVYWDGRIRSEFTAVGRLLGPQDVVRTVELGPRGQGHPMTIDELMILDRALSPAEVAAYVEAVTKLAEVRFPFRQPAGPVAPR
jgi:hypothetical protein